MNFKGTILYNTTLASTYLNMFEHLSWRNVKKSHQLYWLSWPIQAYDSCFWSNIILKRSLVFWFRKIYHDDNPCSRWLKWFLCVQATSDRRNVMKSVGNRLRIFETPRKLSWSSNKLMINNTVTVEQKSDCHSAFASFKISHMHKATNVH